MTDNTTHIDDLIVRLLTGDLDGKTLDELSVWVNQSADHEAYLRRRQELWFSATDAEVLRRYDSEAAFQLFLSRVAEAKSQDGHAATGPQSITDTSDVQAVRRPWHHWLWRTAAAVMIGVLSVAVYKAGQKSAEPQYAAMQVEVPMGSRAATTLPDGSVAWLNAGSHLTYSQGFGITDRRITLTGEGYFEVTHNERLPFTVVSTHLTVSVLGTKFNVRDYAADRQAVVTLTEGSIEMTSVGQPSERHRLQPGQRAVVDKQSGRVSIEACEPLNATNWTRGVLMFDGETLSQIAADLSRTYNVSITLADHRLDSLHFYGDFLRQEQSIGEVLDALAATGRITYTIADREVTIGMKNE